MCAWGVCILKSLYCINLYGLKSSIEIHLKVDNLKLWYFLKTVANHKANSVHQLSLPTRATVRCSRTHVAVLCHVSRTVGATVRIM